MEKAQIGRINELAHKAKAGALSEAEQQEQRALRQAYLAEMRAAVTAQLEHTVVELPDGTRRPLHKNPEKPAMN